MKKLIAIAIIMFGTILLAGESKAGEVERVYLGAAYVYHDDCASMDEDLFMLILHNEIAGYGMSVEQLQVNDEFQMGFTVAKQSSSSYKGCMDLFEFLWTTNPSWTKSLFK